MRFAKCSLTVRPVQFRSPLAKIITTSKRKCARSCGVGDAVQGGGRSQKQYLSVLQGCISAHCANIRPHNLAFSVARSPTRARSLHFGQYGLMVGSLPSRALVQMSLRLNTSPPLMWLANCLQLIYILQVNYLRCTKGGNTRLLSTSLLVDCPHSAATPTAHPSWSRAYFIGCSGNRG